jgi:hypothetical protein
MSFSSNYKAHAFSREEVLNKAEKYIQSAVSYNGIAYGDYVVNVIVPVKYLNKSIHSTDFNTLNLWFKTEQDRANFEKENHEPTKIKMNIKISVSKVYPVNDVSINLLTWNGKQLISNNILYSVQYLIKCISYQVCHSLTESKTQVDKFRVL